MEKNPNKDMADMKMKILASAVLAAILVASCGKKGGEAGSESAKAPGSGVFETGQLIAVNSRSFILPRFGNWYQMRVIDILEHGAIVKAGDSIIELDPTEIKKYITDREADLEAQEAALEKMLVNQDNRVQEAESTIRNDIATFNLRQIEYESSKFESERIKRIKELEFEQAKITLAKSKRRQELSDIINENELVIQHIRVRQAKKLVTDTYALLPQLVMRTPISGVFQIAYNYRTRELVKAGDELYYGAKLAEVPDLEWMKVETQVNEVDFRKVKVGQKVAVRLDALPKVVFNGEVSYMGKLCRKKDNDSKQKVFDIEVAILESDARLRPGMTVSCEFL